jgi:DNA-binding MarR family transcriptional regulator
MTEDKPGARTFPDGTPASGDPLPDHLPRWLEAVSRRLTADLGKQVVRELFPTLRGNQRRILSMIPPAGARITDMAFLADMTKQSLGEVVDGLERSGFVASRRSTADGRLRIVSRTQKGDDAVAASRRAIDVVEQQWRAELGAARYEAMMDALRELGRDQLRF